jgi:phosphatidylethanolamine/phosphatidyl-N-methylethanolamine N-methyltransferase
MLPPMNWRATAFTLSPLPAACRPRPLSVASSKSLWLVFDHRADRSVAMMDDGRAYWNRHARNYDRSMALLGKPLPRMLTLVAEAVSGLDRVLEVAAGTGLVTAAIARSARQVIATDYAPEMVAALKERVRRTNLANVRCERADVYALSFQPASFEAVVAANVLHLVPDLPGALDAFRRQLEPGGRLVVPTFCHDETALSWGVSRVLALTRFPGERRFRFATLHSALESAGLEVTRTELISGVIPIAYAEGVFR